MKITKIETQKRNEEKANVFIDDKYSFSITLNGLVESGLYEGMEISEKEIESIKTKDENQLAFLQALNTISYGMKTESEMRRKLREKKFSDNALDFAIQKMKDYSYLDDEYYVKTYITSRAIPQNWGKQKIIGNLLKKGISMDMIKEGIESIYGEDLQKESIMATAEKYCRNMKEVDTKKKREKLYRHLASKGFSYDLISYAVSKYIEDNGDTW